MNSRLDKIQNWAELAIEAGWSASSLAKKCDTSLRTLERYFILQKGKSPKDWLIERRQKVALKLLEDGVSVKEVASLSGYKHATTFAREFKRLSGHCPTALPAPVIIQGATSKMSRKATLSRI